eukprot:364659-Chlamydomonas_euryale.AAC.4
MASVRRASDRGRRIDVARAVGRGGVERTARGGCGGEASGCLLRGWRGRCRWRGEGRQVSVEVQLLWGLALGRGPCKRTN